MVLHDPVLRVSQTVAYEPDGSHSQGRWHSSRRLAANGAAKVGVVVAIVAAWWVITAAHVLPSFAVPSPSAVWAVTRTSWQSLIAQTGGTVEEIVIAVASVWVVGALLGILIGMTPGLWPLLGIGRALYAVPIVVVYPLLSVWFGVGSTSKIVFGFLAGVLPMTLMSAAAVRSIDDSVFVLFSSLGVNRSTMFRRGMMPAALPGVVSAMRLSGSLGLVGVIIGEMLLSSNGLGYWIANAASQFEGPTLYEGVVVVVVLAVAMNGLIGFFEQRLSKAYG